MIRPLELFIGLRYTRAKRRNHFISFISVMATLGIVLGITAMITVLSVMNGFGNELRQRILGVVSHVSITTPTGRLRDWQGLAANLNDERIIGAAPYVEGQAMLTGDNGSRGVVVRGIDSAREQQVVDINAHMIQGALGQLRDGEYGIILGRQLAWRIGATLDSKVSLVASETMITPAGLMPRFKQFRVVGIFEMGVGYYDDGFALVHLADAARVYRKGNTVTGLRLKLDDLFDAKPLAHTLEKQLGKGYRILDWSTQQANFFRALKIEKTAMFITLTLIIAVAAFNIVSMLMMLIADKQADIAIFRTLGLSPGSILQIFLYHGMLLGTFGTALGVLFGVTLSLNISNVIGFFERLTGSKLMSDDVYYVSTIVADLHWQDVGLIALASFLLTLMAAAFPAWRAAGIAPAQALRYE